MVNIIAENSFFIVIDKPYGVSVHNESPSVQEFLIAHKKPLHFVNRLDQETSGLMLIAQEPQYQEELRQALNLGQKIYKALLRGRLTSKDTPTQWSWPLTDKAEGRKNPQGQSADRKPCLTLVKAINKNQYFSEIEAEIKTGRQHQIRKHSALAKHPIVGDRRYNDPKYNERITQLYGLTRLCLHAYKLQFKFQNKDYTFISDNFDFKNISLANTAVENKPGQDETAN